MAKNSNAERKKMSHMNFFWKHLIVTVDYNLFFLNDEKKCYPDVQYLGFNFSLNKYKSELLHNLNEKMEMLNWQYCLFYTLCFYTIKTSTLNNFNVFFYQHQSCTSRAYLREYETESMWFHCWQYTKGPIILKISASFISILIKDTFVHNEFYFKDSQYILQTLYRFFFKRWM